MSDGSVGSEAACPRCAARRTRRTLPPQEVVAGEVRIGLPPRERDDCPAGHAGRTETVAIRSALDRLVRARWRPTGAARCGRCPAPLTLPARTTSRAVTVEPADAAPWTLELRLPLTRCPDCGVDNVPVAATLLLRRAVRGALRG